MAYDKTVERIDNQQPGFQQLAKQTLSWIVYATRQLSVLELRHALAVEDDSIELDEDNLAEIDEIIHACAGLVTLEEDTNIIRLVHYTTQEYLEHKFLTWEPLGEEAITRTCLTYLSFDLFKIKKDQPREFRFNNAYFLDYAIDTWHNHAEHCWNDAVEQLVVSFLEGDPQILNDGASRYIRLHNKLYSDFRVNSFKTMHFAALFGLARTATALLQAGYNTRVVDWDKRTPLTYAAEFGHQAVARLLLKDADLQDKEGNTPLHFAAENGHEKIVKLLLDCEGIDVNGTGSNFSPLNLAIQRGHEGVAKLLLERADIDVSRGPLGSRDTALMSCAMDGSEGILQQLLKRDDLDLNCRNDQGETALMLAAENGNTKVFKQLLEKPGVEVHLKNWKNQTLLMLSVTGSSLEIVELLLNQEDINVNCQDNKGQTALILAIFWEKDTVVPKLLGKKN